ncbi:MAG: hypothetical protein WC331_11450 [Candidatus Omnitrophota bacterium]|jgi:hypothetical protein
MTLFEAQAAAPILTHVFGDAEVRQSGSEPYDYFVRVYMSDGQTVDVPTADDAGKMIVNKIQQESV